MNLIARWTTLVCAALTAGAALAASDVNANRAQGPNAPVVNSSAPATTPAATPDEPEKAVTSSPVGTINLNPDRTHQQVDALSGGDRAKFDSEKTRLLAKLGRGPDGKLIASAQPDEGKAPAHRAHKHHRRSHHRKAKPVATASAKVAQPDEPVDQKKQ